MKLLNLDKHGFFFSRVSIVIQYREGDDTGEEDDESGTKLIISRTEWGADGRFPALQHLVLSRRIFMENDGRAGTAKLV